MVHLVTKWKDTTKQAQQMLYIYHVPNRHEEQFGFQYNVRINPAWIANTLAQIKRMWLEQ